ncbi:MAG TPA: hypothetical protein VM164_00900 [Burkholderiales bacterium]|nr:hypothetical protein [Burkholderiales bacterium]
MKSRVLQVVRPARSTKALRRELGCVCCVFLACALLGGCDEQRQQKPKVARDWSLIPNAVAQQADQVVPPAAISGANAQQTLIALREHLSGAQKLLYAAAASR